MAMNLEQELKTRFSKYSGNSFNISTDVYKFIAVAPCEEQANLFKVACNCFSVDDSDYTLVVEDSGVTEERKNELKLDCGETVNALLKNYLNKAVSKNISEEDFYSGLWYNIVNNSLFQKEEEKWFATYYILIDSRIPFFEVQKGLEMSNEAFGTLIKECKKDIQKIRFIMSYEFDQKTMEASNILDVILAQDTYEKKTIIISIVLSELRKQKDKLLELLKESLDDND